MYARVKAKSLFKTTVACGGITFTQDEWRRVPAHEEDAAKADPLLETTDKRPEEPKEPKAEEAVLIEPAPEKLPANNSKTVKLVNRKDPAE